MSTGVEVFVEVELGYANALEDPGGMLTTSVRDKAVNVDYLARLFAFLPLWAEIVKGCVRPRSRSHVDV
jgi:hypothetical protein